MSQMFGRNSSQLQEAIRHRATELFRESGGLTGRDIDNWYQAEAEILRESTTLAARRAVVVNVDGVVYTGEYDFTHAEGYSPGEWKAGDPVTVRLAGDQLFLRRPNGRELQTTVVKRIG